MRFGRPRLATQKRKAQVTGVRLNVSEREVVEQASKEQNKTLSQWIRDTLVTTAQQQLRRTSNGRPTA
jgi:uncharacterized protein (DUF1778 family)